MSFYRKIRNHKNRKKEASNKVSPDNQSINFNYKRTFLTILPKKVKGSMTVEAAIVVPFFLFVVINLMGIVNFFYEDSERMAKMAEGARNTAVYMYAVKNAVPEEITQSIGLQNEQENDWIDDNVDLYKISFHEPVCVPFGFFTYCTVNRATCHMWTGYQSGEGSESATKKEYVYIAVTGKVYHTRRDCTYISPTIQSLDASSLISEKNGENKSYQPCERCKNIADTGVYYITKAGDKYHKSISCSALKRTIFVVTKEEAIEQGRTKCSKCP